MGLHIGAGSAFSLGMAASLRKRGGVLPGLTPYTFEVETENLVAAFATPPSVGDKRTRNRFIKR